MRRFDSKNLGNSVLLIHNSKEPSRLHLFRVVEQWPTAFPVASQRLSTALLKGSETITILGGVSFERLGRNREWWISSGSCCRWSTILLDLLSVRQACFSHFPKTFVFKKIELEGSIAICCRYQWLLQLFAALSDPLFRLSISAALTPSFLSREAGRIWKSGAF